MAKVLIIGAGGVGQVVAHKCAQVPEVQRLDPPDCPIRRFTSAESYQPGLLHLYVRRR